MRRAFVLPAIGVLLLSACSWGQADHASTTAPRTANVIVDTNDVVYYVNFSVFFLFLCSRVLESNRWRS